ncbi:F0F1 ATP synthase subunit delta [Anaerosalibacter bizertensis]|uniref:ATP synthase subunit delta n=1 Tax=Anaerosalibacter bizertensis TaxID=932217 RepID=A0A844FH62_9FIRM|nr:F0F1 ATP synthase subunit delta [Anaerosalibacter bizertensis]MBV1819228.1 F0F1 ATP synthase subunit delta [Bacteroidales bacterium MSK.15.36]MBU5293079.1 F0F1 ATP synthase subunit delta [Anaerosalibacter bizertensis]MCB5559054.1 F0F1 ATP synthase subunit delta [Anaerosalibacter bizertensis]MCG4564767.1 F0F1 ATP synthase subunit delta [Anaerosalibacter bizertensis]MCG4583038.1 F0F1 ATP synthase subunit delta [Anaerosalibacter bizertensis]
MAKLVSKRYALALFETGLELDKIEEFKNEISFISKVLEKEPDLEAVLIHPKITKDEKKNLVDSLFKGSVSQELLNFLYVIIDKRRERYIREIDSYYHYLYNEEKNILEATAITAVPMDRKAEDKLKIILSNKLGKNIVLKNVVDKEVVGGVMLKVENKIIDGTVKGQLESIEKNLKSMKV